MATTVPYLSSVAVTPQLSEVPLFTFIMQPGGTLLSLLTVTAMMAQNKDVCSILLY